MRLRRSQLIGLLVIVFLPLTLLAWQWQRGQQPAQAAVLPTLMPTAELVMPTIVLPTDTAVPTATQLPTATATTVPISTQLPTLVPTETATATAVPINRICPDPIPLKPIYDRYVVTDGVWPTPDPALISSHFWLAKPLPGGGRFLINQNFPYGYDLNGRLLLHNGVDSAEPLGTPVLAVGDGTVIVAQDDMDEWYGWRCDWYGHLVVIELDQTFARRPLYALYGHVLNITVEAGQRVRTGEQVAEVGFGGAATAPHLHFELRVGTNEFGSTLNPMLWLNPGETRGIIAGRLLDPEGRPWRGVGLSLIGEGEDASSGNTWSYLDDPLHYINPDPGYAENFVFADVKPGEYEIYTKVQGVEYQVLVTVEAGAVSTVEIVTEPYKIPTATPEVTVTPEIVGTAVATPTVDE
ncbi:MAG: M23 family metallopeptidase [Ardenticatenaceae bacterium]|nr:M23 family metallopeptidase [Ardenticatenaceae bacterium]